MKVSDIITPVNSNHGAPMGRREYGRAEECPPRTVQLFKVPLNNGGYDQGGAYWGHGEPLWCAFCEAWDHFEGVDSLIEYRRFTRAHSRKEAMVALDLAPEQLRKPL